MSSPKPLQSLSALTPCLAEGNSQNAVAVGVLPFSARAFPAAGRRLSSSVGCGEQRVGTGLPSPIEAPRETRWSVLIGACRGGARAVGRREGRAGLAPGGSPRRDTRGWREQHRPVTRN